VILTAGIDWSVKGDDELSRSPVARDGGGIEPLAGVENRTGVDPFITRGWQA